MKKYINFLKASIFAYLAFMFSGCLKDTCRHTYNYTFYKPVYKATQEVRSNMKSNAPKEIKEPGKIVILGNYIFLNEINKGIHVIDNTNPSAPINVAFIDIPGNIDIAVKGTVLYADLYTDLVTLDISNPLNVAVKKYNEGVFPFRVYTNGFYGDSSKVIVDWIKTDTAITEDCYASHVFLTDSQGIGVFNLSTSIGSSKSSPSAITGQGGSMARFTIVNNTLYTVSDADLNVFNITNPAEPLYSNKINFNTGTIETIFPFKNELFIGAQSGMYIYNINDPNNPKAEGQFGHVQTCDPVIADDAYAYVTLRSGNRCQGFTNELDILGLSNFNNPQLLKTYNLTNPHGLSKDDKLLFICDGEAGLKVYDASDVLNLKLKKEITDIETFDVIANNKIALVVAKDGLYQYTYADAENIHLLSKINIVN